MDDLVRRARGCMNDAPIEIERLIDEMAGRIEADEKLIAALFDALDVAKAIRMKATP